MREVFGAGISLFSVLSGLPIPIRDVIPAQAGIHAVTAPHAGCRGEPRTWIPACAGMTRWELMAQRSHACLCAMGKVFIASILASMKGGTLYTGVTGNPAGRIWQHKTHAFPNSFTARHKVERLVWYEVHEIAISAIQREKRIKDWQREWKERLIEEKNSTWRDLSHELGF